MGDRGRRLMNRRMKQRQQTKEAQGPGSNRRVLRRAVKLYRFQRTLMPRIKQPISAPFFK